MYYMILMFAIGTFSQTVYIEKFELANKDACVNAATQMSKGSKGIAISCMSKETGEIVLIKDDSK